MAETPGQPAATDSPLFASAEALASRLHLEPDEVCVVSVAAAQDGRGTGQVAYASILFGPTGLGTVSWPEWAARTNRFAADQVARWRQSGGDVTEWAAFQRRAGGRLFDRSVFPAEQREAALGTIGRILGGTFELHGTAMSAELGAPTALVRTSPHMASQASLLTLQAQRPTTGVRFPLVTPDDLAAPPTDWPIPPTPYSSAPLWMLGLPIAPTPLSAVPYDPSAQAQPGLYVGVLERRAWIVTAERLRDDPSLYLIRLGLDERRVDLADLELDVEEYVEDTLASARRVRLGDLDLPATREPIDGLLQVDVHLPTLGTGVSRQVRLYDRDGLLLDATDRLYTADQINIDISWPGGATTVTVGDARPPGLLARLHAADEADERYRQMLEAGLPGRLVDDERDGPTRLRDQLARARGHLLILDPYFSWHEADWTVL